LRSRGGKALPKAYRGDADPAENSRRDGRVCRVQKRGRREWRGGQRAAALTEKGAPFHTTSQSSMIATARTGAPVVLTHLIGNTQILNPCGGSWSRFVMFSRW